MRFPLVMRSISTIFQIRYTLSSELLFERELHSKDGHLDLN